MKTHLKVKRLSLEAERSIIKRVMKGWNTPKTQAMYVSLYIHQLELKSEVRAANIAYGYLRGREYAAVENTPHFPPNWSAVEHNIHRFGADRMVNGQPIDLQAFHAHSNAWLEKAKSHASPSNCLTRRVIKQEKGAKRRQAYKARYWRPEPADQAKLKAELKAKWEGRNYDL